MAKDLQNRKANGNGTKKWKEVKMRVGPKVITQGNFFRQKKTSATNQQNKK